MSDPYTGVAAANMPYATPPELRSIADIADHLNSLHKLLEGAGNGLTIDDVAVYDGAGSKIGVLTWHMEADSFGVSLKED
jgi:2-keto-3-deoxy-6-phosphogluconate aldolase